ncbi:Fungalysin metallopeptidase-domain-containing protein [Syncephalis plumigaleata]|nr:Fungalysin metallopeptidase-domain-containing protein [Syncephalis plumigaleata]
MRLTSITIYQLVCLSSIISALPSTYALSKFGNKRVNVATFSPRPTTRSEVRLKSPLLQHFSPPDSNHPIDPVKVAIEFLTSRLKIQADEIVVRSQHITQVTGVTHIYCKQVIGGFEVANGDVDVHVSKEGQVMAYGDSFFKGVQQKLRRRADAWNGQQAEKTVGPKEALAIFAAHINQALASEKVSVVPDNVNASGAQQKYLIKNVPFADRDVQATRALIQNNEGKLESAWEFKVHMPRNYFHVYVLANGERIISLVDWVVSATYRVVKIGNNNPADTPRELVSNPDDKLASPAGWHDQGNKKFTTTIGNNVYAQENLNGDANWENKTRPDGGNDLVFDFPHDASKAPVNSINASITNLFYVNNIMHDIFYRYGFTEATGNFQENNWGKGGRGGDAVKANAIDGDGTDNADFEAPPDGERPQMRMFAFTATNPSRDGDLENDIVSHEYGHGISIRLTGGPDNSDCLAEGQSAGMGEGWSDFFAYWLEMRKTDTPAKQVEMGKYVIGRNIRTYPYAIDMKVNPLDFARLLEPEWLESHKTGEVWAVMLYEMYWNLVTKLGFNEDRYSADITKGNTLALKIVVDALKLQVCRPNFINARDSILQAEQMLTGGKHRCEIWKAFAKRGLGEDAKAADIVVASTKLPQGYQYTLQELHCSATLISNAYEVFSFNKVIQELNRFTDSQLSAFYFESIKERLYADDKLSLARRSAQTAVYHIIEVYARVLAPITCHLAEEIQLFSSSSWSTPLDSVFQSGWISLDGRWHNIDLEQDWTVLRHLRSQYYQLVEKMRQAKGIKTSAQIDLTLELEDSAISPLGRLLQKYASQLPELFLCASVNVAAQSTLTARNDTVLFSETISLPNTMNGASGQMILHLSARHKCPRCWSYRSDQPECLCNRCQLVVNNTKGHVIDTAMHSYN